VCRSDRRWRLHLFEQGAVPEIDFECKPFGFPIGLDIQSLPHNTRRNEKKKAGEREIQKSAKEPTTCKYMKVTDKKVRAGGCKCKGFVSVIICENPDHDTEKKTLTTKNCTKKRCRFFTE